MGFDIAGIAQDAVQTATNTGLGLLLQGHNDRRQLKQQEKLNELQLKANKQQMDYEQMLALELWDKTNYAAQVGQLKKAGLGVGLMYGKGGGAGGTTSGAGSGGTQAQAAPAGGGEILGLQLMQAQKNLIEAQTEKTQAEARKTAGVDTNLTTQQERMQRIQADFLANTYHANYSMIETQAAILEEQYRKARVEGNVAESTELTQIKRASAELMGMAITNELRRAEKDLTEQQITQSIETIAQRWEEVEISKGRLELERFIRDVSDSTKLAVETVGRIVNTLVNKIPGGGEMTKGRTEERGWGEKTGEYWRTTEKY